MDDLKVVFYIAVGIAWVIYNNYRKISEASRKRNISNPNPTSIPEAKPKTEANPKMVRREIPVNRQVSEKQKPSLVKVPLEKRQIPKRQIETRKPLFGKKRVQERQELMSEGGFILPSKVVQFEESSESITAENPWISSIRNSDFKQAIVLAEILKRPYN